MVWFALKVVVSKSCLYVSVSQSLYFSVNYTEIWYGMLLAKESKVVKKQRAYEGTLIWRCIVTCRKVARLLLSLFWHWFLFHNAQGVDQLKFQVIFSDTLLQHWFVFRILNTRCSLLHAYSQSCFLASHNCSISAICFWFMDNDKDTVLASTELLLSCFCGFSYLFSK